MARASALSLTVRADEVPLLSQASRLAQEGFVTGASHRNWLSYRESVRLPPDWTEWRRHLLTDPQTSGGLLIACVQQRAAAIVGTITAAGYPAARVIGVVEAGPSHVRIVA